MKCPIDSFSNQELQNPEIDKLDVFQNTHIDIDNTRNSIIPKNQGNNRLRSEGRGDLALRGEDCSDFSTD